MSSTLYSLSDTSEIMYQSLTHYKQQVPWANESIEIIEILRTVYHTLSTVSDATSQLQELGEKALLLEQYLMLDLQKQVCICSLGVPYYMERLHSLAQQAYKLLSRDIKPEDEACEFVCSKSAAHLAADLQATFVEYGFCTALDALYDIGEAQRRLNALQLKVEQVEKYAHKDSLSSTNNNNSNTLRRGMILAELQDTVAQLHGMQQALTEDNMAQIANRYDNYLERLSHVEKELAKVTIDVGCYAMETYAQMQQHYDGSVVKNLYACDIRTIYDEQMIHPGTRSWLLERLLQWFYTSDKRLYYVSSRKGYGKTALSATICKWYNSNLVASHFFQQSLGAQSQTNSVVGLIQTISAGLCKVHPQYLTFLSDSLRDNMPNLKKYVNNSQWQAVYDLLLKQPLFHLFGNGGLCRGSKRKYLIVVDALDECRDKDWADMKAFVERFIKELPGCFKLFVTCNSHYIVHLLPAHLDAVDGMILENRAWINRHIRDVEIYLSSSLGAILSGEEDVDTPRHAKSDDMTLQDTVDSLLKMTSGRFDYAMELMQSFSIQMKKGGQFLGSVKKALMPVRQMHGARAFDEEMGEFASPFRAYRDKEGRSVSVRVMRQSIYPMDKSRVALIHGRHKIQSLN